MGRFAVQSLLRSNEPIGRLRGRVHRYQGVPLIVTYHPAYLLRNLEDKARAWDDLCLARATFESPGRRRMKTAAGEPLMHDEAAWEALPGMLAMLDDARPAAARQRGLRCASPAARWTACTARAGRTCSPRRRWRRCWRRSPAMPTSSCSCRCRARPPRPRLRAGSSGRAAGRCRASTGCACCTTSARARRPRARRARRPPVPPAGRQRAGADRLLRRRTTSSAASPTRPTRAPSAPTSRPSSAAPSPR